MGFSKTLKEMVGRTDMLEFADMSKHWKARHLDLSVILHQPRGVPKGASHRCIHVMKQDHEPGKVPRSDEADSSSLEPAIETRQACLCQNCLSTTSTGPSAPRSRGEDGEESTDTTGLPEDTITLQVLRVGRSELWLHFSPKAITLDFWKATPTTMSVRASAAADGLPSIPPKPSRHFSKPRIRISSRATYDCVWSDLRRALYPRCGRRAILCAQLRHSAPWLKGSEIMVANI